MVKFNRLRGVKDVIPPDSAVWEHVIKRAAEVMKLYNYKLIVVPTIEERALFVRGIGDGTDIVVKEMYDFKDKKGRDIVLRPEGTASVVRAYIENSLPEKSDLYYIGQMFRYEKPQKGRDREFFQIGVESFGDPTAFKDAEVIKLCHDMLKNIAITSYEIHVNSTGCKECRPKYALVLVKYLGPLKTSLCGDCQKKMERGAAIRVLDCKDESCKKIAAGAPKITEHLCAGCAEHHGLFKEVLSGTGIKFIENPNIVRGLDYYTRTVFEFITDKLGAQQNTVLAGGRYNNLVHELGGKETPAVGFAAGIERIAEVLAAEGKTPAEAAITAFIIKDKQYVKEAFKVLNLLRDSGISAVMSFEEKSFKSQFREADSKKTKYAVILGENEIKNNSAAVKNMTTGSQEEVKIENLKAFFNK